MKCYSVVDFRKSIRKALNQADAGQEVYVERYGEWYKVTKLAKAPKLPEPKKQVNENGMKK